MANFLNLIECSRCGAKLKSKGNGIYECEYCGAQFSATGKAHVGKQSDDDNDTSGAVPAYHLNNNVVPPPISQTHPSETKKKNVFPAIIGIFLVVGGMFFFGKLGFSSLFSEKDNGSRIEEKMRQYVAPYFGKISNLPADFVHHDNYSVGVVIDSLSPVYCSGFCIGIPFYNKNMETLEYESKYLNLDIESVAVSDNKNRSYDCTFDFPTYYQIEQGDVERIGTIYCDDMIMPDVRLLNVQLVFANFGTESFDLDLSIDFNDLEVIPESYRLSDYEEGGFTLFQAPNIKSEKNYILSIDQSSLSVVDNLGNVYDCEFPVDWDDQTYFSNTNYGPGDSRTGFGNVVCKPNITDYDINRVVMTYTLQDKVISLSYIIDER